MATILIVDDECSFAEILSFALEDEGFTVVTASNGRNGLELLNRSSLIITDFKMPVMDGLEFATSVRALPFASHLPIILMGGAQAYIGMNRSDLFDSILAKPFDIDLIITEVRKLLLAAHRKLIH